ncbi:hypothetical protein SGL43_01505 [Streptomyces globisporus]|uniref:Uncharacterized protein n=1 Tax=Streptomyces globisporus TaxID=1908 RepID=A0ABN8UZQ0_STRGL|nr:hypothetical protein SGL43_01505 [Streptomyces globisporus]
MRGQRLSQVCFVRKRSAALALMTQTAPTRMIQKPGRIPAKAAITPTTRRRIPPMTAIHSPEVAAASPG